MLSTGALAVLLLQPLHAAPPPPDEPRALIRRAIREMGGEAALRQQVGVQTRFTGKAEATGSTTPLTGVMIVQPPEGRPNKGTVFMDRGDGTMMAMITMNDGERSWRSFDGFVRPLVDSELDEMRAGDHADRVRGLIALLQDKGFTLRGLDARKVANRDVQGVNVSYKGQPDVRLFFDKASGLLVRYEYRVKLRLVKKEVHHVVTLGDYLQVNGGVAEERLLRSLEVGTTDKEVMAYLRRQVPNEARLAKVRELVRKLGDEDFAVRERAEADLIAQGRIALPFLRPALKGKDLEVGRRAKRCIAAIEARPERMVTGAAVRLVALRRMGGGAHVLLEILPSVEGPIGVEVRAALAHLAVRAGKPEPALVQALKGANPVRREAALAALGKDGGAYLRGPGRRLFAPGPRVPMTESHSADGYTVTTQCLDLGTFNRFADKEFVEPRSRPGRPVVVQ
jgi:hypothetical protein